MNVQITVRNVNRDFVPDLKTLQKLLKVTQKHYRSPVVFKFIIAQEFTCNNFGHISPISPVEVTVEGDSPTTKFVDRTQEAQEICSRICDLLDITDGLTFPAIIVICFDTKKYVFSNRHRVKAQEWRG